MAVIDASHQMISDLLHRRTGQQLTESRRWRISTALGGLFRELGIDNVDQLACMLEGPGKERLGAQVVEALLNNETYFFRDHVYFMGLANQVLPDLARKREDQKKLTIWSAGCSTGQEALSLAMLFTEQKARWQDWEIDILGTDVSGKAIATAKAGCYTQFEIQRGISVAQMLNFFSETPSGWQASDALRSMTRFQQHSILDLPPSPGKFDLILCRNVLLYFDAPTRRKVFDRIAGAARKDGWLMLGAGESVIGQTEQFEPSEWGSSIYKPVQTATVASFSPLRTNVA